MPIIQHESIDLNNKRAQAENTLYTECCEQCMQYCADHRDKISVLAGGDSLHSRAHRTTS